MTDISRRSSRTIDIDGVERRYLLYVPPSYARGTLVPLFVTLHSSGSTGSEQLDGSQLERVAQQHGFVIAAPDADITGTVEHGGASRTGGFWNVPGVPPTEGATAEADAPNDVQFLEQLVDHVSEEFSVGKVVATGTSGGARMACALGCATDRFDVVAPVAGLRMPPSWAPRRPIDLVAFHGTDDQINPYLGGGLSYWGAQTVPEAAAVWAHRLGCPPNPTQTRVTHSVTRTSWTGGAEGVTVTLYTVEGGGHAWPGGLDPDAENTLLDDHVGTTTRGIDAGEIIWKLADDSSDAVSQGDDSASSA